MLDQLAEELCATGTTRLHVDISEWLEAGPSELAAIKHLHAVLDLFDRPQAKRRPAAVTQVMKEHGLLGCKPVLPAFALRLAGAPASGPPVRWLQERRPRRQPEDARFWVSDPNRYFLAGNGSVVIGTVTTRSHLHSIVRLTRADRRWHELPMDAGMEYVYPSAVSHDGRALFGCWQTSEHEPSETFRWLGGDAVEMLPRMTGRNIVPVSCSDDGMVVVGWSYIHDDGPGQDRAWWWRERVGGSNLLVQSIPSKADHVSADGRRVAGAHGGDLASNRAFVWCEERGFQDLGIEGLGVDWFYFAPDGTSGLLRVSTGQRGEVEVWSWLEGAALELAPEALNPLPSDEVVRVVGDVHNPPDFTWKAAASGVVDERALQEVYVRHQGPNGAWVFATRLGAGGGVVQFLIWRRGKGWSAWNVGVDDDWIDVHTTSQASTPEELVVLAAPRRGSGPFLWSLRQGVEWFPDPSCLRST